MTRSSVFSLLAEPLRALRAGIVGDHVSADRTATGLAPASVLCRDIAPALYEIAYSARQHAVFVASAGGLTPDAPQPRIYRLDPETLAVQAEILLERKGLGLKLDDEADRLYIGNAVDASVTVLDTATHAVIAVIQLAQKQKALGFDGKETERYPHNLRELILDKTRHRIYAPGIWLNDSALYVIDTKTLSLEKVIPGFGFGATGATLDEQGGKLYVSNMQGQVHVVDTTTLTLDARLDIAADQLLNMIFDRRRGVVLATDHGADRVNGVREKYSGLTDYRVRGTGNRVVVWTPGQPDELVSVPTGKGPVALLIDETRNRLYVTNRESGTVSVFDSSDYRLLDTVALPIHPNSLALDPVSGAVYVSVKRPMEEGGKHAEAVARILL